MTRPDQTLSERIEELEKYFTGRLDGLRELIDERDRLYNERHQQNQISVDKAMAAAEKAVNAALAAAKEASFEQKEALKEYKLASNEWRATVTELSTRLAELGEIKAQMRALEEKVGDLKNKGSKEDGKDEARGDAARRNFAIIGLGITVALFVIRELITLFNRGGP